MGYQDIDRRREGTIGGIRTHSGSFDQNAIPYQYSGEYGTETRIQFPFESQWIQISALTSDAVKFAFRNAGTGGGNCGGVGGNSSSPVMYIKASEIYVLNDAAITVGMSNIPSGSNTYDMDTRY
jgi:hypothetical protein